MRKGLLSVFVCLALSLSTTGLFAQQAQQAQQKERTDMALSITSPDFRHNETMPRATTCDGAGLSAALAFAGVPANAQSLALIVDDPDAPDPAAPQRVYVHWVLANLPPETPGLPAGVKQLPPGTIEGFNDREERGYVPACPPVGTHRYFHKLYALDRTLDLGPRPTKVELLTAMKGHVLAEAELIGLYKRGK
jgi:Raf kinase inhibitor-like YbhB/YbcL family protein